MAENIFCGACLAAIEGKVVDVQPDPVKQPSHYAGGDVECIDAIGAAVANCSTPMEGYLTGNVIKYMWRWQKKGGEQDLRKAIQYINRLINHTKGKKAWEL